MAQVPLRLQLFDQPFERQVLVSVRFQARGAHSLEQVAERGIAGQIGPRRETADAVRDLWSYIDVRDAAEGFRLALDWQGEGHLRAYLSAADTYLEEETASALARALPDVPVLQPLDAFTGLISTRLAEEKLGFVPRHSWRDYANEDQA